MPRVDPNRMPPCEMARVVLHWTAGAHKASALDKEHYHVLVEGDGTVVYGMHAIDANAKPAREPRASHTRNLNTGSIGVSLCCMRDAVERPFSAGPSPMTVTQWQVAAEVVAELCASYNIAVTPRTVLAHGEVQAALGVAQLQKWDPLVLPFTPNVPRQQVMEQFRASVQQHLNSAAAPSMSALPSGAAAPPPQPATKGPFTPQSQKWRSDQAVLLVHGVGNARQGDYVDVIKAVQDAAGPDVAVYSLFYDVFNDWLNEKADVRDKIKKVMQVFKTEEGDGQLPEAIAEFAADVIWPIFATAARESVQRAYLLQMKQIVKDGLDAGLLKQQQKLSIVSHSLGCFHTYELLHAIATQPAHTLRPLSDGIRFRSVVFMASPVQLIRTLASRISGLVPSGLATAAAAALANPSEEGLGAVRTSVERWISVTGDLDPIGGHFLHRKAPWAYMDVTGQQSFVVPQTLVGSGDEPANLFTLLRTSMSSGRPPTLNNPHSWLDYLKGPDVDLKSWLA
ncbi:MAG TPA: peptidoglycan recognition family protein [Vicinamibacterales bacterium]|nr:peptidoglycan recognition family protein [Vicinamibacterales bacterium]